jgi:hypothetical protein
MEGDDDDRREDKCESATVLKKRVCVCVCVSLSLKRKFVN